MTKTKFTPDQKIQIVLESFRTGMGTAELCRKPGAPTFIDLDRSTNGKKTDDFYESR